MSSSAPTPVPEPVFEPHSFGGYLQVGALEGVTLLPRALARIIDLFTHYAISYCAGILFGIVYMIAAKAAGHQGPLRFGRGGGLALFVAALLGSAAYEVICENLHGSTLGKLALSMVVVQEDGTPCRFKSAVIRSFALLSGCDVFRNYWVLGYEAECAAAAARRQLGTHRRL